jgi:hypothetical protein
MLQPHQRAALIPNEQGVIWTRFLDSRFVQPVASGSFAVLIQSIVQKSNVDADLKGLLEISSGSSLPVVFAFDGGLNLEAREISIHQLHPEKRWDGQVSENGRVMLLREPGQTKPIHLVHESTLEQLV